MEDNSNQNKDLPRLNTGPIKVVGRRTGERRPWNAREWLAQASGRKVPQRYAKAQNPMPVQLIICFAIIALVVVVRGLDIPQSAEVFAGINEAITTDSDLDKAIGKLQFVGNFFQNTRQVFNPEEQGMTPPIKDMVVETGGSAVYVLSVDIPDEVTPVLAAADGQVFYAGSSNEYGTLVRIRHQEGYETYYGGVTYEVKAGHTVLAGERIGYIQKGTLKFMVLRDGTPVDARAFLAKSGD